jgi:predicted Rossmann fold flavoprotein
LDCHVGLRPPRNDKFNYDFQCSRTPAKASKINFTSFCGFFILFLIFCAKYSENMIDYDVIIIGAGAAGLMCAIEAGKRGRKTLLLDHAKAVGEKIRISGGGRCNFTNIHTSLANYISSNPRFCMSALARYTPADFIKLVEKHHIAYHEKTLGQLFCDGSSKQIIAMLLAECEAAGVEIRLNQQVASARVEGLGFRVIQQNETDLDCQSLVIATGGLSIPKMGATGFGYDIAKQFGLNIVELRPALVPFIFEQQTLAALAGISLEAIAECGNANFREGMLFTHRGLSGPAILQISSYWNDEQMVKLNLAPNVDVFEALKQMRQTNPRQELPTAIAQLLPKKLANYICEASGIIGRLSDCSNTQFQAIATAINEWVVSPDGTEGYRTAEVTLGGVDTRELSSKTMEANAVKGLYFIGEVVDVTGHLGGFNFQWAWASGHAAGQYI